MLITKATLDALRTSLSLVYRDAYSVAPTFWEKIATEVPSSTTSNTYGWMAQLPRMREWLGERVVHNLAEHAYVLLNKDWELTYAVKRNDIEDDNLGVYKFSFTELGTQAKKHPDDLMVTMLQTGQNVTCFDGQPYFSTAHPVNEHDSSLGTYSNYESSGRALTAANYEYVRAKMMSFVGDNGKALGIVPDLLVVPPQLEAQAKRILQGEFLPNATVAAPETNVNKGTAELLMVPELAADATTWYLLCTKRVVKPFVFQVRRAPQFVMRTDVTADNVFHLKRFEFGADARDNAGVTLPFLAYKAVA